MATMTAAPIRIKRSIDAWSLDIALLILGLFLVAFILLPLSTVMTWTFYDRHEQFVGLANYATFLKTPALSRSIANSLSITLISTAITTLLAFAYAFAITRTAMPGKGVFKLLAQIPILAPSLLPGISLVYLFGNQGPLRDLLMGNSIYGPIGIIMGEVFYAFPHAMMLLTVALSTADARLYEAAISLGAGPIRRFFSITLPGARYGLISAVFVVFTLIITDFGVPKVVGGQYNVLATDVYKQVVGQQNFGMGAVAGMVLLIPALLAFVADWIGQRKQTALLSARSVPYTPPKRRWGDATMFAVCTVIAALLAGILGTAAFASLITYWPYDLTLSFKNYSFGNIDDTGWGSYRNSLTLSALTAVIGTIVVFTGAYLVERGTASRPVKLAVRLLSIMPLAVPGMVLGLSYIFFFNHPANPLHGIYGTMTILVLCTVVHFYTLSVI